MNSHPTITEHTSHIYSAGVMSADELLTVRQADARNAQAASREAAERQMTEDRALAGPPSMPEMSPPPLRGPKLPDDFATRLAELDEKIYRKGVAVNRDRLVSLGRKRFEELLALDREARSVQRVLGIRTDLSSWASVEYAFQAVNALTTQVPRLKISEEAAGLGADREAVRTITGFEDLWKARQEPATVRNVYRFYDRFAELAFGQSVLERLSSDSRARSKFFVGGRGDKVRLFDSWLDALNGPHFRVVLLRPLWSVLKWLTKEQTPPFAPADWARENFNVRAPTEEHVRFASAIFEGFLRGYSGWALWQFAGRLTRKPIEPRDLEFWRDELATRYPAITNFHRVIADFFWRDVGMNVYDRHREFDSDRHRRWLDAAMEGYLDCASALTALALDEKGVTVTARFQDSVLCQGPKPKAVPTAEKIESKLSAAFPASSFAVEIEGVQ